MSVRPRAGLERPTAAADPDLNAVTIALAAVALALATLTAATISQPAVAGQSAVDVPTAALTGSSPAAVRRQGRCGLLPGMGGDYRTEGPELQERTIPERLPVDLRKVFAVAAKPAGQSAFDAPTAAVTVSTPAAAALAAAAVAVAAAPTAALTFSTAAAAALAAAAAAALATAVASATIAQPAAAVSVATTALTVAAAALAVAAASLA